MAKKKRKNRVQPPVQEAVKSAPATVPEFEIGKKGDEFDRKYTRAAAASKSKADALLRNLSKETRAAEYNLINAAVLVLTLIVLAMSFAFLSRSGDAPKMRLSTLSDGSYTAQLSEYYRDTLPFGRELKSVWAFLGFTEMPEDTLGEPLDPDEPVEPDMPDDPSVTDTPTLPAVTTAPSTDEAPTSAPITEPSETTIPETKTMYVRNAVNIRMQPNTDSMIMGYYDINDEVEVIELRSDGWAEVLYNGIVAYISSDFLGEETIATTKATRRTTTEPTTEETTEEITTTPEETSEENTTVSEEITTEATTEYTVDSDYEYLRELENRRLYESWSRENEMQPPPPAPTEPITQPIPAPEPAPAPEPVPAEP